MLISRAWLSDYVEIPKHVTPAQLAHDLTLKTVEVEKVEETDDDVVLDIDNKSLTNRPDLWGHYGIARELAAIYALDLAALPHPVRPTPVDGLVKISDPGSCARFAAVSFQLPDPVKTPAWMAARLQRVNLFTDIFLVDLSNYVMLTTGQPNHVYDRDRVSLPLTVQSSESGETFTTLSGAQIAIDGLTTIRDGSGPVGLAGVVGSLSSGVHADSRRGLLEVASFPPLAVRRASQRTGVRTEASARYEKAIDTQRVDDAIDMFLALLMQEAPGTAILGIQDVRLVDTEPTRVVTPRSFLDSRIGEALPSAEIRGLLLRLGFTVEMTDTEIRTTSPTWRSTGDVSQQNDILEEIARLHGYDRLPIADIGVTLRNVRSLSRISIDRRIRECLAYHGRLNEVITYPWVTDSTLAATGSDKEGAVIFNGAPSPDRNSLRRSLLPNLLESVQLNRRYSRQLGLFEVGTVFDDSVWEQWHGRNESMPKTAKHLGVALTGADREGVFRRLTGLVTLLKEQGWVRSLDVEGDADEPWADPSAQAALVVDGARAGTVALLRSVVLERLGISDVQVGHLWLDLTTVSVHESRWNVYRRLSDLPTSTFDLSVVVAEHVRWVDIYQTVRQSDGAVSDVRFLGDFRGSWVPADHKSVSLRVTLIPTDHTFSTDQIQERMAIVLEHLEQVVGARLRQQV